MAKVLQPNKQTELLGDIICDTGCYLYAPLNQVFINLHEKAISCILCFGACFCAGTISRL